MQVFISWSGDQSNAVAVALRAWLPEVLADKVKPFVSSEDIDKGSRGLDRIASELQDSGFGIVVITPANQGSTWVAFEAGALGKSVETGRVLPLLVGLTDAELVGPLKQFQNSAASEKEQVRALVKSVNKSLQSDGLPNKTVDDLFNLHWHELEEAISSALAMAPAEPSVARDPDALLDEVVTTVRSLQREVSGLGRSLDRILRGQRGAPRQPLINRRVVDWTDPNDVGQTLFSSMIESAGGSSYESVSDQNGTTITLSDDTPKLSSGLLADFQGLARSEQQAITIKRSDGSSITYDADGQESRMPSKQVLPAEEVRADAETSAAFQTLDKAREKNER